MRKSSQNPHSDRTDQKERERRERERERRERGREREERGRERERESV